MLPTIACLTDTLFLWAILIGGTLVLNRYVQNYALTRLVWPALACMALNAVEHTQGLGNLSLLGLILFGTSLHLIQRNFRKIDLALEISYSIGFLYCLLWRLLWPDIEGRVEATMDAYMVACHATGATLPPPDLWAYPFKLNCYYTTQFYWGGIIHRLTQAPLGTTYQLIYCTVCGQITAAGYACARLMSKRRSTAILATLALCLGGTGANVYLLLLQEPHNLWDTMRFVGSYFPEHSTSAVGKLLSSYAYPPGSTILDVPLENTAYLMQEGDYHPPFGGIYIYLAALYACLLAHHQPEKRALGLGIASLLLPLGFVTNTWQIPLQLGTFIGIIAITDHAITDWRGTLRTVTIGILIGTALCLPALQDMAHGMQGIKNTPRIIDYDLNVPFTGWLIQWWPFLFLATVTFLDKISRKWGILWLVLLTACEWYYINDIYGGRYERFNTELKNGIVLNALVLLTCLPIALDSPRLSARWASYLVCFCLLTFVLDLGHSLHDKKLEFRNLEGTQTIIDQDASNREILSYLDAVPQGVTLIDPLPPGSNSELHDGILAALTGKQQLLGAVDHVDLWHGYPANFDFTANQIELFYDGKLSNAADWLTGHDVRYIVWHNHQHTEHALAWSIINQAISTQYSWVELNNKSGLWVRRS